MQTTSDTNKAAPAGPAATDHRPGGGAATSATELGRHYGEHGHPATTNAGPAAHEAAHNPGGHDTAARIGEQARSVVASGTEAAHDMANRVREQVGPAIAKVTETAQDLAHRTREQAAPAAQAVYDQGARAGQYVTRNIHEYPATALLIAAAIGYSLAYLIHGGGRSLRWGRHEYHNRYSQGAH
jgi:ElaB/YqjD/DUF883 family membrane-anchored ribosome-binding protein